MAPFGASRAGLMSVVGDDIPDSGLSQQAVMHWLFFEGEGTKFVDSVNNVEGSLNFDRWELDSEFEEGTAPNYDGLSDEGVVAADDLVNIGDEGTVAVTHRPDTIDPNECFIGRVASDDDNQVGIRIDDSNSYRYGVGEDNNSASANINSGQKHALILTWENGSANLYQDRDNISSDSYSGTVSIGAEDMGFGFDARGQHYHDGPVDDVVFDDSAWNSSERDNYWDRKAFLD